MSAISAIEAATKNATAPKTTVQGYPIPNGLIGIAPQNQQTPYGYPYQQPYYPYGQQPYYPYGQAQYPQQYYPQTPYSAYPYGQPEYPSAPPFMPQATTVINENGFLNYGDSNQYVANMQQALGVPVTGEFDDNTLEALGSLGLTSPVSQDDYNNILQSMNQQGQAAYETDESGYGNTI